MSILVWIQLAAVAFSVILFLLKVWLTNAERQHDLDLIYAENTRRCEMAAAAMRRQRPKPPPPPSFFQQVVGVTVDDWYAADTPTRFAELLQQRDKGKA